MFARRSALAASAEPAAFTTPAFSGDTSSPQAAQAAHAGATEARSTPSAKRKPRKAAR